ncbi:MAG: NfeD family protein [Candidatus Eisenbacteria bacterium]|nr:NfeD family protein [Candidatus Eisenbacteria bacterium]
MMVNWLLVIAGAVLILIEVVLGAVTGFDFLLIGSAILLGGVLGLLTKSAAIGVAAGGILSLLYVFAGRRRIRNRWGRGGLATNTDAILGKTVQVVETISSDRPGRIRTEGEEWRACLDAGVRGPIEPGSRARVTRIDGVTLYVVPEQPGSSGGGA